MAVTTILDLVVRGDPVAKARARVTKSGGAFTPRRTAQAEAVLATVVRSAMAGRQPVAGPVGIAVQFYCATRRRADGDNLLKLVTDALNRIAYEDDSQILEWFARVHRGVGVQEARTEIFLWSMEAEPQ